MINCEYCKLPMDGVTMHTSKCRKYYADKYKEDFMRGHK